MKHLVVVISGVLFALGLALGGMTDPAKVIGFLDVFGDWDPSLIFVMGGAVALNLVTFRFILRRPNPLLGDEFVLPGSNKVDVRLVAGAALFGAGWGVAGLCPGPALVSIATGGVKVLAFVAAMLAGMAIYDRYFAPVRRF